MAVVATVDTIKADISNMVAINNKHTLVTRSAADPRVRGMGGSTATVRGGLWQSSRRGCGGSLCCISNSLLCMVLHNDVVWSNLLTGV